MRTLAPFVSVALLAACGAPDRSLKAFDDCDQMAAYMQKMAADEVRWDWRSGGINVGFSREFDMALESADVDDGGAVPPEHSDTNLQEAGVDEADLVKTDGVYLYALAGGELVINRAWPVSQAAQLGHIRIDGYARGMYLLEDGVTVVVISDLYYDDVPNPRSGAEPDSSWNDAPSAVVTVVDVSDPTSPVVERETYITGQLETSRRIGDKLYVVTYEDIRVTEGANSRREARAQVYDKEPDEWQGRRFDNLLVSRGIDPEDDVWTEELGTTCDCDQTYYSDQLGGTYVANAMVLDLSDPLSQFNGTAVVGRVDTVYSSLESLYVVYSEVDNGPFTSFDDVLETVVHKFDISEERPRYTASGVLPGVLTDQFALSEKDGILRIATTDFGRQRSADDVDNGMYTVEEIDGTLEPVDYIIGLGTGESITAARFVGDFGYISTFAVQFGDPLFTFDLSDPYDIKQGGELAVTGWSDYLHPIDEGKLLAVGMENEGTWSLQVSLFDVTDIDNPRLAQRELLPAWGSEAQNEHHAFTYLAPTVAIPSWANQGDTVLEVIEATGDGIEPIGRVHQSEAVTGDEYWCGGIRRSVIIGDWVWAVSNAGMTAARIDDPGGEQFAVAFEDIDPCAGGYYGEGWW